MRFFWVARCRALCAPPIALAGRSADSFPFGSPKGFRFTSFAALRLGCHQARVPPTVIPSMRIVGNPTPTGTDCPSLPQVPTPESSDRSLPTIETRVKISRPVADKSRALYRARNFTIFDQEGLAGRKNELAVGYIDLASAKTDRVESVLDGAHNFVRGRFTRQHERVRHAGHRRMGEAFRRPLPVGSFSSDARLGDSEGSRAGCPFRSAPCVRLAFLVVNVEAAVAIGQRTIIHDGAEPCPGDLLSDAIGEGGKACTFAIKVAFQPMADRLVKQYPGPTGTQHHDHFSRRSVDSVEIDDRLARRTQGKFLPAIGVKAIIPFNSFAAAISAICRFLPSLAITETLSRQSWLDVAAICRCCSRS